MGLTLPLIFFFVSGACALIYQVVWVRQLLLVVGTSTAAVATVLSVFMGGLGVGAWLFGPAADRSRAPLKLYAYLEIATGLYAMLLPEMLNACKPAYVELARHVVDSPLLLGGARVTLGFLLLLIPTVLMGGTLPALTRHVGRTLERFGADLGHLYGANLAGGVVGSLAAGFLLIRYFGVRGAATTAVIGNLAVGALALWSAGWGAKPASAVAPSRAEPPLRIPVGIRPLLWLVVFLSGLLSMGYEVLWTRILILSFESTIYAFTLILATFLAGLALGSRVFVLAVRRNADPLRTLSAALVLAGLTTLALAPMSGRSREIIDALSGRLGWTGEAFLLGTFLSSALVLLVPATLMGIVLPLAMRLLVEDLVAAGRRVGHAYLVNTLGCVTGALVTSFGLVPWLGLNGALLTLAGAQVAAGWVCFFRAALPRNRLLAYLGTSAAAFLGASYLLHGPGPFQIRPRVPGAQLLFAAHRDGVAATVDVVAYSTDPRARHLFIDGFEAASDAENAAYMPLMAHIPLILHPDPRRVLVVCFGTGSTAGAGLLHPNTRVDTVDINSTVFEFAPYFAVANQRVYESPRARLIVDDGRNFLLTTTERYDVITSEPMPPHHAGVVNLYSREYYELARDRLEPGGFVVQWLPLHLVTFDEARRILRTVQDVFPQTTLWMHKMTGIIVARRDAPVRLDFARLADAYEAGPLRDELGRLGLRTPLDLAKAYVLGPEDIRAVVGHARAIVDDHPSLEFHQPSQRSPERRYGLTRDQALALQSFAPHLRSGVTPVDGAAPEAIAELRASRERTSRTLAMVLQRAWGLPSGD